MALCPYAVGWACRTSIKGYGMARVYTLQHNGRAVAQVLASSVGAAAAALVAMGWGWASVDTGHRLVVASRTMR